MATDPVIDTTGIVGTDGVMPIYNGNAAFQIWDLSTIYVPGSVGANRFVPKVGDLLIDTDLITWYKVLSIDPGTLQTNYILRKPVYDDGSFDTDDLLLGVGPGTQSDTYRIYVDKSVTPYTLSVDARLSVAGSMVETCRIFRGADLTDTGNIVSNLYDNSGNIIATAIPLEKVSMPTDQLNYSVKTVPPCYTMQDIADGEILTAVFESTAGNVVSKRQLLAENTTFTRPANTGLKYVTGIALKCPFLSRTNPRLINLPINVLLQGLNLIGVVSYSDGSTKEYGVDSGPFSVLGVDNFVATVVGQQITIVLKYQLGVNEAALGLQTSSDRFITDTFKVQTQSRDGDYNVKLFAYPVWQNAIDGYSLVWYLYNGDRSVMYNVTGLVTLGVNSQAFRPTTYGVTQDLNVGINLQDVSGLYVNYRHTQTVEIVLFRQGTERDTNWTVAFTPDQNPAYGTDNFASLTVVNSNLYTLKVDSGYSTQALWLQNLYANTQPLIDPTRETAPLVPTHFRIRYAAQDYEFPISQWNSQLTIAPGLVNNGTLFIEWLRKTPDTTLQLSVSGLPIYQTS